MVSLVSLHRDACFRKQEQKEDEREKKGFPFREVAIRLIVYIRCILSLT